jgi:hypothetical protein
MLYLRPHGADRSPMAIIRRRPLHHSGKDASAMSPSAIVRFGVACWLFIHAATSVAGPPATARAAEPGITVVGTTSWTDDNGLWVVARFRNDTGGWQKDVWAYLLAFDSSGQQLGSVAAKVGVDPIAPGTSSAVRIQSQIPGVHDWRVSITSNVDAKRPVGAITAVVGTPEDDGPNGVIYPVTLSNPNDDVVGGLLIQLTLFDAAAKVINTENTAHLLVDIPARGTATTSVLVRDHFEGAVRVEAQAIGGDAWSHPAAPTWVTWDDWFEDITTFRSDIVWLAGEGITNGCAKNRYCPTAPVTRAQMAMFLVRAFDYPAATGPDHFNDDDGVTGESSINALFEAGITGGCAEGRFCPMAYVTRAQMALFMTRALDLPPTSIDFFTDDNGITGEAAINRIAAAGITGGCGGTEYCPKAKVSRGQMAAFLRRALH